MSASNSQFVLDSWTRVHNALIYAWQELENDSWERFRSQVNNKELLEKHLPALNNERITKSWSTKLISVDESTWAKDENRVRTFAALLKEIARLLFQDPSYKYRDFVDPPGVYRYYTLYSAWVPRSRWNEVWPPSEEERKAGHLEKTEGEPFGKREQAMNKMLKAYKTGNWNSIHSNLTDRHQNFIKYFLLDSYDLLDLRREIVIKWNKEVLKQFPDVAIKLQVKNLLLQAIQLVRHGLIDEQKRCTELEEKVEALEIRPSNEEAV